jgi:hypothetical protein
MTAKLLTFVQSPRRDFVDASAKVVLDHPALQLEYAFPAFLAHATRTEHLA